MTQDNDWWKQGATAVDSAQPSGDWWTHGASPVDAGPAQGGTASDLGKSLKAGVQRLPGMVTGLADLPIALATGARPFTKAFDALGEATGFRPGKWADETKFSQGYEDSKKAVDAAWKDGSAADIAGAYLSNPGYTANQVVESLPSMVAGGVASKTLMGVGRVAGVAADAAAGTAARAATPGLVARAVGEKWAAPVAGGIGEGAVTAGQQMANYQGDDQQKGAVAALGAGVGTGLIGVGAGRLANEMGFDTAETAMANLGSGAQANAPASLKKRVLGGMVSEGLLQELPQSAQEQMWQNFADGKPLMDGVARAGTEGALAGAAMGAGANLRGPGAQPAPDPTTDTAPPDAPPGSAPDAPPDAPPSPAPQLGYSPLAGTPTVFPDGSVALGSEAELAHRYAPQPVKPSEQMGLNPAAGPLSAAAVSAVDSGAYMPPAGQAPQPATAPEPDPVVLQNRDRTSAASIAQMQEIAANPDYLRTGPSRDMTSGAPIVFGELPQAALLGRMETVVDGNGERMGTQYAVVESESLIPSNNADGTTVAEYASGLPGKLRAVAGNGRTAGLQAAYQQGTANNYAQELMNDAGALGIDPQAMASMQRPVLVRVMGQSDVTPDMGDRLMSATFKQAYDSDELVQLHAQATDPDARSVLAAAADASGVMAALRGAGDFDVRGAVTDAVKMAVNASRQGLKLSDVLQNADFDMNPEAYPVATFLAKNIRSPKAMAEGLRRWGQLALQNARTAEENQYQGGLLGPAPTLSRQEIFARIGDAYNPTEQAVAARAQPQAPVAEQASIDAAQPAVQPAAMPVPGNFSGTPSASMGARTDASAGPGFGPRDLKSAIAQIRAQKQQAAQQQPATPAQQDIAPAPTQGAQVAEPLDKLANESQPLADELSQSNAGDLAQSQSGQEPTAIDNIAAQSQFSQENPNGEANAATPVNDAAQAAQAPTSVVARHSTWRKNAIQAGRVARELGLAPKGKSLPQIVAEVDAHDAAQNQAVATDTQAQQAIENVAQKPVQGPFGPILTQYRHDAQGAIKALTALQDGEAVAALHHPEVGDIDLVWGNEGTSNSDGLGLAKLVKWHPEVLSDLQGLLNRLNKDPAQSGKNRTRLVDEKGTAVVRLQWNGDAKNWLLTAFENAPGGATRTDTGKTLTKDDTASLGTEGNSSLPPSPAGDKPTNLQEGIKQARAKKKATNQPVAPADTAQEATETVAKKPPAKRKLPPKLAAKAAEVEAQRAAYFAPGNVVASYAGHDRVVAYTPADAQGNWSVTVQAVQKQGNDWVNAPGKKEHTHSTQPDARALKAGPVVVAKANQATTPAQQAQAATNSGADAQGHGLNFSRAGGGNTEAAVQLKETERAYGGREAYNQAKAAGKTKLTYGQWVQVRTPNFKAWFGDWEAARAQDRLDAMEPLKVRVPDAWRGMDHVALRQKMAEELDRMVREKTEIAHPDIGVIRVGRAGAKKSEGSARDPAKSLVAADIEALIPASIYARSDASRGGDGPDIAGYSTLLARVQVDGVDLVASFTVRHQSDGQWYYNAVALHDAKEKAQDSYGRPDQQAGSSVAPIAGLSDFVRRPLARVNTDAASKVVDAATGDPLVVYHGTASDFDAFEIDGPIQNALRTVATWAAGKIVEGLDPDVAGERRAAFFTRSPYDASIYATSNRRKGDSPNVMPVYLAIKSPLVVDGATGKATAPNGNVIKLDKGANTNALISLAIQSKADGLLLRNVADVFTGADGADIFLAFRHNQIKSATGNSGNFDPANPDIRYSNEMSPDLARAIMATQPALATKESVRAAVRELVNGLGLLPNRLGRVVVATAAEIKQEWEPLIGPTGMEASGGVGKAQGFYDPKSKTVFLIADHIKAGDELGVAAHELMHKHGPAVLGQENWDKLHSAIGGWAKAKAGSMERIVYDEAARRVQASDPELSNQELFPYAVQVALEMGVRPNALAPQGTVARWLGQVRAALRTVWEKIVRKPDSFKSQDLVNLAFGIAQRENPEHAGELDGAVARSDAEKAQMLQGKPVAVLDMEDAPVGGYADVARWAADLFKRQGGNAISREIGEVTLNEQSARDSMAHGGANGAKKIAFAAVKDVIEHGTLVHQASHGRKESFYISAPVRISGRDNIVTVLVHRDQNTQRMYLHSVALKENLLKPSVSAVDTKASERSSATTSGDTPTVANVVQQGKAATADVARELNRLLTLDVGPPGSVQFSRAAAEGVAARIREPSSKPGQQTRSAQMAKPPKAIHTPPNRRRENAALAQQRGADWPALIAACGGSHERDSSVAQCPS